MASLAPHDRSEMRTNLSADHIAYLAVSYGLLANVAYRSFVLGEAAWDLLALVVFGGIVGLAYRLSNGAVSGRETVLVAATVGIAIVVSGLMVIAGR